LELLCESHTTPWGCNAINYVYHAMDTIQCLITNPSFYPSPKYILDHSYSAYGNMCKRIYKILAYANHNRGDIYLKYEKE
jgi:hypothetical protein